MECSTSIFLIPGAHVNNRIAEGYLGAVMAVRTIEGSRVRLLVLAACAALLAALLMGASETAFDGKVLQIGRPATVTQTDARPSTTGASGQPAAPASLGVGTSSGHQSSNATGATAPPATVGASRFADAEPGVNPIASSRNVPACTTRPCPQRPQ
jgi:hypothetical protein